MGMPTDKMIEFAKDIAKELNVSEPDMEDFEDVSEFIEYNKDKFYALRNE